MIVKNYHGTIENGLDLKDEDVTVLEAGTKWAVPEPTVANKTVTEFIALENNKKNAYTVKATIKAFKSGDTKDKYGNMTITDGTSDVAIYGSTATATALAWDGAGEYAFTNPQDFLTNETTSALKVGDEITMKLIRADYIKGETTTIQGTGIITAVTPSGGEGGEGGGGSGGDQEGTKVTLNIAEYATANSVTSGTKVSSIALDSVVTAKAEGTDSNTGKIYIGNTGTTEWRFYKSGTGTLKIELAAGYVLVSAKGGVSTSNYGDPTDTEFTIADNKASYTNTSSNFNIKTLEVVYKAA